MCGRISCHLPRDVLTRACAYRNRQGERRLPEWRDADKYCPSYNKSPRSSSPVLLSRLHFEKVPSLSAPYELLGALGGSSTSVWFGMCSASEMTLETSPYWYLLTLS